MLRKRLDRNQRLKRLRALPVCCELLRVTPRPLADEAQRAGRERSTEDTQRFEFDKSK